MSSTNDVSLLGSQVLLVDDIAGVGNFLACAFSCSFELISHPLPVHAIVKLSAQASLILVQRGGIDSALLATLGLLSVNQIFLTVRDAREVQKLATQAGANVTVSNIGDDGVAPLEGSLCVFEGPERIVFHVITTGSGSISERGHEYIMSAIHAQANIDDEDDGVIDRVLQEHISMRTLSPTVAAGGGSSSSSSSSSGGSGGGSRGGGSGSGGGEDAVTVRIPTLDVSILSENSSRFVPCPPNSREVIPFETEFFKGVALLLIRTEQVDEKYQDFFPKSRQFEVQVQGKFKRLPQGEIFVGAEAVSKMELGFMTRSFSKAVLSFTGSMVSNLHYSFGDVQTLKDHEIPHLVAPMFPTMDKILVTPLGSTPPKLGTPFQENLDYRKQRIKYKSLADANIDLTTTYSFSVNTSGIDLPAWKFVNIPMCRPMDMSGFFGDSAIRLVAYEIPWSVIQEYPNTHPQRFINYVFNIVLNPLDADNLLHSTHPTTDDGSLQSPRSHTSSGSGPSVDDSDEDSAAEDDDEFEETDEIDSDKFSFRESISPAGNRKSGIFNNRGAVAIKSWFQRKMQDLPDVIEIPESPGDHMIADYESEAIGDLRLCPATIEVFDKKKEGRSTCIVFLLPWSSDLASTNSEAFACRLRSYNEVRDKFAMVHIPKLHKNKKMSLNEKRRRQIVESYKAAITKAGGGGAINSLLQFESDNDRKFLSMHTTRKTKARDDSVWEGNVAFALSNRFWTECFLVITPSEAILFKYQNAKQIRLQIPIETMMRAKSMRADEIPFSGGYAFLKIETLARVFYFMLKNERVLVEVKTALAAVGVTSEAAVHVADADDTFPYHLDRPPTWKLGKKMLYNCRRIIFTTMGVPQHLRSRTPCELVEVILAKAINLSTLWVSRGSAPITSIRKHELIKLWVDFLDELSVLQVLDIPSLSECERAALFLNLFHVMVIHGSLVLGPPQTRGSWQQFFNDVAYITSFDVVSIAEVEHNILRAAMSRPPLLNQTTARIPRSNFPGLALTHRDFRFNFCINHGSISMPRQICIFRTDTLDKQLDEVRFSFLKKNSYAMDY